MWQGSKQQEYQLNPMQIVDNVMPYQLAACSACIVALEMTGWGLPSGVQPLLESDVSSSLLVWIGVTCGLAVAVNIVTYALIGKTSPVTYQVVGHLKTVLILLGGYLFFTAAAASVHAPADNEAANEASDGSTTTTTTATTPGYGNVLGATIALVGMVLYSDVKSAQPGDAWLHRTFPTVNWKRELF